MKASLSKILGFGAALASAVTFASVANAQSDRAKQVSAHWTQEKIDQAIPRDFYLDHRGLAYVKGKSGKMEPYGHGKPFELKQLKSAKVPQAKPPSTGGGSSDTTPPDISSMSPADGATIGTSQTFSAVVTDAGGIRSVTFTVNYTGGTQSFTASFVGNDTYEVSLQGFPAGAGSWYVTAADTAKRGGNVATSPTLSFTVGGGGGDPGPGGDIVENSRWSNGGAIQTAAGRLFYEMPSNKRLTHWAGYVCSGTAVTDSATGRSIIITAAHCVYDDANKGFARNVLFIPNQDGTTGAGTDTNCNNDPVGCWTASFGVVDDNWTTRTFPDNIPWDYAYYVVDDSGAHSGAAATSDALDSAVGTMEIQFIDPVVDDGTAGPSTPDYTFALGYSYSDDPYFMYCSEDMTTEGTDNWWLPSCGLSGGASGGPWIQPMNTGSGAGPLISVNSWGYSTSPGMAGPKLAGTSASCLFEEARLTNFNAVMTQDGYAGIAPAGC